MDFLLMAVLHAVQAETFQSALERRLQKLHRGQLGPLGRGKMFVFVDDVSLPDGRADLAAGAPLELLRQLIDYKVC